MPPIWQALLCIFFLLSHSLGSVGGASFPLTQWRLSSSSSFPQDGHNVGQELSITDSTRYSESSWYNATIPATVMGALQQSNTFEDPYYADNILKINATLFSVPWYYSTSFVLPENKAATVLLTFKGVNYKADVWLNGQLVANTSTLIGTFRYFDFDITSVVLDPPSVNTLLVSVTQPIDNAFPPNNNSTDLAITFVDWNEYPPDNSMGIWRDVIVTMVSGVTVRYPAVTSELSNGKEMAHLQLMAELTNWLSVEVQGLVNAYIPGIGNWTQLVTFQPMQTLQVTFSNDTFNDLNVAKPLLWWPWQMGPQNMLNLTITFIPSGSSNASDTLTVAFGIRQVTSFINTDGFRQYQVNGQNILIRGAGWTPDMFLVYNNTRLATELAYVKWMGLNSVRLEGKMEPDEFFEIADELGLLILPGWCCCDAWQHWSAWGPTQYFVAQESLRSQVKRLRIHPSVLVFLYSSDELPPPKVEALYLTVFNDEPWPAATLSAASAANSTLSGPTGVKMSGPYSWVPPTYWLSDNTGTLGGAYGFLTEGGPGENPLTYESLTRTVKSGSVWPIDSEWDLHCGNPSGVFSNLRFFTPPLEARYGKAKNARDYSYKSQLATYEGHRAMFEGYSRNKYRSTGVIQWMLNNAWPEMIWHLYDYYLNPGGAFFGTLKACEPQHIMYSYNDGSVWVINSQYTASDMFTATAEVYNIDASRAWIGTASVDSVDADGVVNVLTIPSLKNLTTTYFVRLKLAVRGGATVSTNVYWLSTQPDVLDWKKSNFYRTACKSYANFTALDQLPNVTLNVTSSINLADAVVTITNPTKHIALAVHARLIDGSTGNDVAPVFWSDNFVTIWPGDHVHLIATYTTTTTPTLHVEVFNSVGR